MYCQNKDSLHHPWPTGLEALSLSVAASYTGTGLSVHCGLTILRSSLLPPLFPLSVLLGQCLYESIDTVELCLSCYTPSLQCRWDVNLACSQEVKDWRKVVTIPCSWGWET